MKSIQDIFTLVVLIMIIGIMIYIIYSVKKSKYIEDKYGFYAPIKFDHFIKLFAITPEDLRKDTWELKDFNVIRHVVEYKMIKHITEAQKNNWRFIRWVNPEEKANDIYSATYIPGSGGHGYGYTTDGPFVIIKAKNEDDYTHIKVSEKESLALVETSTIHTMFNRKDTRKYRKWKRAYEKELQNHHIRNGQIRELEKFNNAATQDIQNYLNRIERESQEQLDKLKAERKKRINLEANYAGKNQGLSEISS